MRERDINRRKGNDSVRLLPDLVEIKKMRASLGISQRRLASSVGISQSMLTKIENRRVRPSYELVTRIFETLESFQGPAIGVLRDIQVSPVVFVNSGDPLLSATVLMHARGFKQLPVKEKEAIVGSITERTVSKQILRVNNNPAEVLKRPVSELMEEPFPIVSERSQLAAIIPLLQHTQAVLTTRRGRVCGIVTNADLIKVFLKNK